MGVKQRGTSSEGKTHTNLEQIKASWYPGLRRSRKQFLNTAVWAVHVSTSFLKTVFLCKCCPLVAPSSHSTSLSSCPLRAHLVSLILSNRISHKRGEPPAGLLRKGNVLFLFFSFLRQGFTHFVTLDGLCRTDWPWTHSHRAHLPHPCLLSTGIKGTLQQCVSYIPWDSEGVEKWKLGVCSCHCTLD